MKYRFYCPRLTDRGWRITYEANGFSADVCGAINEVVALDQCAILNALPKKL